jgi:hypothetical protein
VVRPQLNPVSQRGGVVDKADRAPVIFEVPGSNPGRTILFMT